MSARLTVVLCCDQCGVIRGSAAFSLVTGTAPARSALRQDAALMGWYSVEDRDYCADCGEERGRAHA